MFILGVTRRENTLEPNGLSQNGFGWLVVWVGLARGACPPRVSWPLCALFFLGALGGQPPQRFVGVCACAFSLVGFLAFLLEGSRKGLPGGLPPQGARQGVDLAVDFDMDFFRGRVDFDMDFSGRKKPAA